MIDDPVVGNDIEIPITVRIVSTGALVDPSTLRAIVTAPDGTVATYVYDQPPSLIKLSVGEYLLTWKADQSGRWHWEAITTGIGEGTGDGYVDVRKSYLDEDAAAPYGNGYRPTVDEVAARTYARTLDDNGNRGSYSDTTKPTAAQVEVLIDDGWAVVQAAVGNTVPATQRRAAKYAVICRAAMAIERGNYPEATNTDDGAYQSWSDEYDAAIGAVTTGMNQDQPNQSRIGMIAVAGDSTTHRAPGTELPCLPGTLIRW